ncbi:hypothetical protein [Aerococcus sp. 1KP-2016]|uniref:hypothetical protein n=1 Tax=Aerococcus sp. 1KP-2016 TaxID=1981982 RepID=UPI000B98F58C|nr:hypothetical protein [Aerococcus sp. 1KP-2016]OYQ68278.1 hypothetical protein B9P78_00265 [Aerococcus sp. 1KP-2016]
MELTNNILTWILVGGSVLVVIYMIIALSFGVFLFKEYKKSKKYHDEHAKKMAEMRKDFDNRQRKNKTNRFR